MELLGDVVDDPKFTFTFPPCEPLQKPIVLVNALTFGYRPERILLEAIDLRVDIRSRIGVVGGCVWAFGNTQSHSAAVNICHY